MPLSFRQGVVLHRRIDSFTDRHSCVRKSVRRLRPRHGRYAPVILDVLHDFILSKNWHRYSKIPLSEFAQNTYAILERHLYLMPPELQDKLPRMIADNWLMKYGTEEGLKFTLERVKRRSSKPRFYDHAVESMKLDYQAYEADFNLFFPDVIEFVNNFNVEDIVRRK